MSDSGPAPSSAPPGRTRGSPRYRAGITLALVAALITGSLAAVAGPLPDDSSPVVSTYVPSDGAVQFARQQTTGGGRSTQALVVTESARISGSAVLNALDWNLATRLIGALGSDRQLIDRSRFWRTITIPADAAAAADTPTADAPRSDQVAQTRVYTLDDDVALAAESGPGLGFTYLPNLVELPAGVRAGQTWRSSGTAGAPTITYAAEFTSRAAEACLEVNGTVTYSVEQASLTRKLGRTWCPGGLVRETDDWVGTTVVRTADQSGSGAAPRDLPAPDTTDAVGNWAPARWRPASHEVGSVDPNFGEGPMSGTPASLPPVPLRSGLVLQATSSVSDIVAAGPDGPDGPDAPDAAGKWRSRWRAHPGGQILTLTGFGDMAVVTTSARTVVGYDSRGVRRWTLPTREVVRARPVRMSPDEVAVAGLDGEVVGVDLVTGAVRWRTRLSGDVRVAPASATREVMVADGSNTLTGLDAQNGDLRWTAAVEAPVALAPAPTTNPTGLAVLSENTLGSYDAVTHELTWRRWFPGTARTVVVAGDSIVARAGDEVLAFALNGTRRWARPGTDISTDGRLVVVWGAERAGVLDPAGAVLADFATRTETAGNPHRHLATERGVFLFDSSWTFSAWTDG